MSDPRVWARGKTYEEVLGLGDQMLQGLQRVVAQNQQQPAYQPPPKEVTGLKDDDIVDGRTLRAFANQVVQQSQPTNSGQLAQMALGMVRQEPKFGALFSDYEPEILGELSSLPATMWTLDNIRMVANLVAARHLDEIADKRAQVKMANMSGLPIRGNGLGSATVESDGLPTNWQDILQKKDLSLSQVESFCVSNDMTVKQWFAHFGSSPSTMGSRS